MLIGLVGDVHGRAFHAIAALATWQRETGRRFDLIIQAGDMGACPDLVDLDPVDPATHPHLALDPSEADFSRLLRAEGQRAESLRRVREQFASAIHFIRGNHEDFAWLRRLPIDATSGTVPVDPFDLFRYVPDATVLTFDGLRVAFLGGADPEPGDESEAAKVGAINPNAHQSLLHLGTGRIDLLVTHDAPYGIGVGFYGQTQGSPLITSLMEQLQPAFHLAGHLDLNGPRAYGRTTFLCLSDLVASVRWHPEARGLQEGCLAVLDTSTATLRPVTDAWLSRFPTPFDFDVWVESFLP